MYMYPPPYWTGSGWGYATPWLWHDGDKHGSYDYSNWSSRITARMNRPSPITQTFWGTYNGSTRQGTAYAKFRNDSTSSITGRVIFVVTEDSCYYVAPNGDNWHNAVARDFLPDQNGQVVTIASRDSVLISRPFTLAAAWRVNFCHVVAFIQSDVLQPDSDKVAYQGGDRKISQFTQIEDEKNTVPEYTICNPTPNPFSSRTSFSFSLPAGTHYTLNIFDILGRNAKTISGIASGKRNETVIWDRTNHNGTKLPSGVYLYRFTTSSTSRDGKIIVR